MDLPNSDFNFKGEGAHLARNCDAVLQRAEERITAIASLIIKKNMSQDRRLQLVDACLCRAKAVKTFLEADKTLFENIAAFIDGSEGKKAFEQELHNGIEAIDSKVLTMDAEITRLAELRRVLSLERLRPR